MHLNYLINPCHLIVLLCFANNLPTDNSLSRFWNFLFQLVHYEILAPSFLYLGVITTRINSVCFSLCNSSFFLFAGHLKFSRNTRDIEDLEGLGERHKIKCKQDIVYTFYSKTNGIHFACKLDCTHIALYHCVKNIGPF
jgi:hypothetical protein